MTDLKEKLINLIVLVNRAYQLGTDKIGIRKTGGGILGFYLKIKTEGEPIDREISFYSNTTLVASDETVKVLKVENDFLNSTGYSNSYHQCEHSFFLDGKKICQKIYDKKTHYYLFEMDYLQYFEEAAIKYNYKGWFSSPGTKETFKIIEVNKSTFLSTYKIEFGRLKSDLTHEEAEKINARLSETNNSTELEILEKITELLK